MFEGAATVDPKKLERLHEALGLLEKYLDNKQYATGDSITVADHALAASVGTIDESGTVKNE